MDKGVLCDGCGHSTIGITLGIVIKRNYCPDCAKIAQAFLDEEEVLRKIYYDNFLNSRKQLIETYSVEYFLLPDVPEPQYA